MSIVGCDEYASVIDSQLLADECKTEAEWAPRAIVSVQLFWRSKRFFDTFTIGDIHMAREWDAFSTFVVDGLQTSYNQLQKHFTKTGFNAHSLY